jgi:Fur family transcriptional regulator, peroxide stress response regulator
VRVNDAEVERRLDRFKTVSRKAGVKLTHQRLEIFREIAASLEHPDAEAVFRAVRRRMPTVSLDTVYRTLWLLNDLGLITTLGPRRESVRFDANLSRHHHFICTRCGLTRDFESAELDALTIPTSVKALGRAETAQVEVRGVCLRCGKETKTKQRIATKE